MKHLIGWSLAAILACGAVYVFFSLPNEADRAISSLDDPRHQVQAAHQLPFLELRRRQIPAIISQLGNDNPEVRMFVAIALNKAGSTARDALLEALLSESPSLRKGAIESLGHPQPMFERGMTSKDDEIIFPRLLKMLTDHDANVRAEVPYSLRIVGAGAGKEQVALKAVTSLLADRDALVVSRAAEAIGMMARHGVDLEEDKVVAALVRLLEARNTEVRYSAAWALGECRAKAKGAIPKIVSALTDADKFVRSAAYFSLLNLDSARPDTVRFLFEAIAVAKGDKRQWLMEALPAMGPLADERLPTLIELLKDDHEGVRLYAAFALQDMKKRAQAATPTLLDALPTFSEANRVHVAGALWDINHNLDQVLTVLLEGLKQREAGVRKLAAWTLGDIGVEARAAIPLLVTLSAEDEDDKVRDAASKALEKIRK